MIWYEKYFDWILTPFFFIFNILSQAYFLLKIPTRKLLKRNRKLKINNDDSLFIIGNGPSLKSVDLKTLSEKNTMVVNYFFDHNDFNIEPTYFVAIDNAFQKGDKKEYLLKQIRNNTKTKFILNHIFYNKKENEFIKENVYYTYAFRLQYNNYLCVNCENNMTACTNVILQCIQIGIYMNYKKIYLLGCDFNDYASLKLSHYYEKDVDRTDKNNMENSARYAYYVHHHHNTLNRLAKLKGIDIINLTDNSLIDAYKRDVLSNAI